MAEQGEETQEETSEDLMLQVTKIIEGGIDLVSGEQIEQGIVIGNGMQEVTIPVSREVLESVVVMYAQFVEGAADNGRPMLVPNEHPAVPEQPRRHLPPSPVPVVSEPGAFDSDYEVPPPSSDVVDDDGFEPGEDYEDSGTGVGSL